MKQLTAFVVCIFYTTGLLAQSGTATPQRTPPLPTILWNFNGAAQAGKVKLQWQVSNNETANLFTLERSTDGLLFEQEAVLFTTEKNGEELYSYTAGNKSPYYRLKVVNRNGWAIYSKVIFIKEAPAATAPVLTLAQNPVTDALQLKYKSEEAATKILNVYATTGVLAYSTKVIVQKGWNNLAVSLNTMPGKGNFLAQIADEPEAPAVKFLKN